MTDLSTERLKPCPFCGGNDAGVASHGNTGAAADWCGDVQWWAFCGGDCRASVGMFETKAEAAKAWNTRAIEADGFVVVPRWPTKAMVAAAEKLWWLDFVGDEELRLTISAQQARQIYSAMIDAYTAVNWEA